MRARAYAARRLHGGCRRRLWSVAVMVVGALVGATVAVMPPAVADYSATPQTSTWSPTDGRVYAIERVGDTIFIGGSFTKVRNPAGTETVARARLAAFDANTGALLPWNPGANNEVRALQVSSDGTGLFVGGRFTSIAGVNRNRLAALRTDNGALVTGFSPTVNSTVMALERIGTRVFLGGTFSSVNGTPRSRIASVEEASGALTPGWAGSADAAVNTILAAAEGDRIFLGGQFRTLSGQSRDYLGALGYADGSATSWRPPIPCTDTQNPCYVFDLAADLGKVYAGVGGPGGRAIAYDIATGSKQWSAYGDGDVQAIAVDGATVYAGGHFDLQFAGQDRAGLVALSSSSGGLLNFAPRLLNGLGVWDILVDDASLRVGGGFSLLDGSSARMRYAEFPAIAEPADGTPPTVPANLRTTNVSDSIATLTWGASSDDTVVSGYRLWRDGTPLLATGVTNYSDRGLAPSTQYTYQVQASDAAGNWSKLSAPITVVTQPPSTSLVKVGSQWRYLSNGSDQGTAWRAPAFDDSRWSSGDAQLGFGDSDETTVISPLGLTHYFRQQFDVDDLARITALELRLLRDDGAIVYVNGVEVWRSNLPAGDITYQTPASTEVSGSAEDVFDRQTIPVDVLSSGVNTVAVEVHNRSGSSDVSFDLELIPTLSAADEVPPSQPQNLRATAAKATTVDLAWDDSTDNVGVTGYRIARDGTVVDTVESPSWTDGGRAPGATHTYTVSAVDAAGNASPASEPLTVTLPADTTPPSAPGTVSASSASDGTRVELGWGAASDDVAVAGYRVLRDGTLLADTVATTYADTTTQPGTTYTYAVQAMDEAGNLGPASESTVTTSVPPSPDPVVHAETWSAANGAAWPSVWAASARSGTVDVQGGEGRLRLANARGAFARATLGGVGAVADTDLLLSYRWSASTARSSFNVYVRGSGGWQNGNRPRTGYGLNFVSDSSRVTVQKNVNGVLTNLVGRPGAQPVGTGKRWLRLRVVGNQLMFRTWADGTKEPSTWTWSGTDSSIAGAGAVYLTHVQQGTSAQERSVFVDDLTLREVSD